MARNYHLQSKRRARSEGRGQFLLISMAFVTGFMSSSILNMNQLSIFLNKSLSTFGWQSSRQLPLKTLAPSQLMAEHQPKLEFYTVLTKEPDRRVPVGTELAKMVKPTADVGTNPVVVAQAKPVEPIKVVAAKPLKALDPKSQFVVQLASFRYASQAEKFRANLLLKGFDVKISAIRHGPMQWYRVMLGPYPSALEAQKANLSFQAKEHATGMVRQMDT